MYFLQKEKHLVQIILRHFQIFKSHAFLDYIVSQTFLFLLLTRIKKRANFISYHNYMNTSDTSIKIIKNKKSHIFKNGRTYLFDNN